MCSYLLCFKMEKNGLMERIEKKRNSCTWQKFYILVMKSCCLPEISLLHFKKSLPFTGAQMQLYICYCGTICKSKWFWNVIFQKHHISNRSILIRKILRTWYRVPSCIFQVGTPTQSTCCSSQQINSSSPLNSAAYKIQQQTEMLEYFLVCL